MERTVDDLEKAVVFDRAVTIPELQKEIAKLLASNASLSDDGAKCRFEIEGLRREVSELKDANSMKLLRLKQEEQYRENWQARAMQAEAELSHVKKVRDVFYLLRHVRSSCCRGT